MLDLYSTARSEGRKLTSLLQAPVEKKKKKPKKEKKDKPQDVTRVPNWASRSFRGQFRILYTGNAGALCAWFEAPTVCLGFTVTGAHEDEDDEDRRRLQGGAADGVVKAASPGPKDVEARTRAW